MAEEEITQKNILEYQKTVANLCRKVAEDPKRYTAYVLQDELPYLIPVSGVLEVVTEDYTREIASLRSLVKELADVAERFVSCKATEYETVCGVGERCIHKKAIALVAKAQEVCK